MGIPPSLKLWKILIIEDSKPETGIMRALLEEQGHEVRSAESIEEATPVLDSGYAELVLLDLRLPEGNGYDLIRKYRSLEDPVDFIVVTGNNEKASVLEALRLGARDYVEKDSHFSETFLPTVNRVLDHLKKEQRIREMERLLARKESRIQKILLATKDAVWEWPDWEVEEQWWSEQNYHLLGYEPGEVEPTYAHFHARVHPEDRPLLEKAAPESFHQGTTNEYEYRLQLPDGTIRWVRTRSVYLERENQKGVMGISEDITGRKAAEQIILNQEEMLRWTESFTGLGGWNLDPATGAMDWTESVYHLFEVAPGSEVRLETLLDRVRDTFRHQLEAGLNALQEQGQELDVRLMTVSNKWIRIKGQSRVLETGKQRISGSIQDISEQVSFEKQKESLENQLRQAQKMEAIGTLAGGIAHDFNNILAIQFGFISLMERKLQRGETDFEESVKGFKTSAVRARDLVAQILRFSRKGVQKRMPLNIKSQLKEILRFMQFTLPSSIQIKSELPDEEILVFGDPTEFHQVVMNLCTNAAQAMENDTGEIRVTLCRDEDSESATPPGCKLIFEDNGAGIPESAQSQIFEAYFTTKAEGKGTGMGLNQVMKIVESMNGTIRFRSESGKGTRFELRFPPVDTTEETVASTLGAAGIQSICVYYIEDDHGVRESTRLLLEEMGCRVFSFVNGQEFLVKVGQGHPQPDVIISDHGLPGFSGMELADKIWEKNPDIPFILVSGQSLRGFTDHSKSGKRFAFLQKPYSPEDLIRCLGTVTADEKREIMGTSRVV